MNYDDFVGQVQHRARLSSNGEAVKAIRATLETLAERIHSGEASDLAAQLPEEIGHYLLNKNGGERFGLDEFFARVSRKEGVDLPVSIYHARVVMEVLQEAADPNEMAQVRGQLPDEYNPLFEAGSQGDMDT